MAHHRKDRSGRGTFDRVMEGVSVLRQHDIPFHVIAVISADSLDRAQEIFDFFVGLGVDRIGFNIEEVESAHKDASIAATHVDRIEAFFERLADCRDRYGKPIHIREFDNALAKALIYLTNQFPAKSMSF